MRPERERQKSGHKGRVAHGKQLGFYLKDSGKPWRVFNQGKDVIQFMFKISLAAERQWNYRNSI